MFAYEKSERKTIPRITHEEQEQLDRCLLQRVLDGATHKALAKEYQCKVGAINMRIIRAKIRMKLLLEIKREGEPRDEITIHFGKYCETRADIVRIRGTKGIVLPESWRKEGGGNS